jgi:Fe-S cluster assembly protein SufD
MSEQQYIDLYGECRELICEHSAAVMNAQRDAAFECFKAGGFPSRGQVARDASQSQKLERYKYTDIEKLMKPDYGLNLKRLHIPVDPFQTFKCDVPNLSTLLYFMVNDGFYEKALPKSSLPEGVIVGSLAAHADRVADYYNQQAGIDDDAITQLNTMLAQDGLLIYLPRHTVMDKTIQVINILRSDVDLMVNRRVLIVAEEGAEATLLFCDHAADDRNFLTTQVIEVFAGENAKVDLYCLEETHARNVRLSNVYVRQERSSRVRHNVITLHNGVTRNKLDLLLAGEGAECQLGGCVIADKQQHVDNNTLITHQAQHCTSNELYKYVLDDQATGAFAGRVYVAQGAQKTTSQMTNQNLTSTREARMYTQPMLEIYADDVKCAHGSTVGQLNDAALFYMQQRGIPEKEARTLLQVAFIREVVDQISLAPLRDRLHHLIDKRFRGELNKCEGCKLCR